jgi:predicted transcriptional regulator
MPPRTSTTLTESELRLMKLLWEHGESSVADLLSAIPPEESLAYTSVLTTIKILEDKGYVVHRKEGRAFLYTPIVERSSASISALRQVLGRFFNGSREQLLLSLLGDDDVTPRELNKLKKRIAESKR